MTSLSGTERVVVIVGALVILTVGSMFGVVAVSAFLDFQRLPSAPIPVSMSEATALMTNGSNKPWVEITDAVFHCNSLVVEQQSCGKGGTCHDTRIIVTDRDQTVVIVAHYGGRLSCSEVMREKAVGVLSRMTEKRYDYFFNKHENPEVSALKTSYPSAVVLGGVSKPSFDLTAYKYAELFMELDNAGGRSSSQSQMRIGAFGVLIALGAGVELLRRLWRVRQGHAFYER
jgi:hypothetical protein